MIIRFLANLIRQLLDRINHPPLFTFSIGPFQVTGQKGLRLMYKTSTGSTLTLQAIPRDDDPNTTGEKIDGPVSWTNTNPGLNTLVVHPDDSSIVDVVPVDPTVEGDDTITPSGDSKPGSGVNLIFGSFDIHRQVLPPEPTHFDVEVMGDTAPAV